jgi:outer membrane protein TolC
VLAVGGGNNLFQLPARFYNVAPAVSVPIFEGGRLRANLKGRDAAYDAAVARYNATLIGALNGIADDLSGLRALHQQVAAQERALAASRRAWDMASQRYKAGVGSYLQALIVRQKLLAAEQRMAQLHAQQVDLSVQLVHALGGGFHSDAAGQSARTTPTTPHSKHS